MVTDSTWVIVVSPKLNSKHAREVEALVSSGDCDGTSLNYDSCLQNLGLGLRVA